MNQNIFLILIIFIIQFYSPNSVAETNNEQNENDYKKYKNLIELSYYQYDSSQYTNILIKIEAKLKTEDNFILNYYAGFINLQLGKILYDIDENRAFDYFDNAIDYLLNAKNYQTNSELEALISDSYAKKASLSGLSAFYWGLKSNSFIKSAYKLDSLNPKTLLIASIHLMYVPSEFGGDKTKSRKLLQRALSNNYLIHIDSSNIIWADSCEIFSYLSQLEILNNNIDLAKKYLDSSDKICPDFDFNKLVIRKQIEDLDK